MEPLLHPAVFAAMDRDREKQAIEAKLAKCLELEQEFREGSTAQMLRDLEEELRQQIRELERQ